MARGLNTETDPRNLPPYTYIEFIQATVRGCVIRPRSADAAHTPTAGSLEEWRLGKLGAQGFATVYDAVKKAAFEVYTPKAGGRRGSTPTPRPRRRHSSSPRPPPTPPQP